MARGVRSNPTLLPTFSPNLQPQSLSSYDPKTRRNTILIAEIVPTINLAPSVSYPVSVFVPSDRYYSNLGLPNSTSYFPIWYSTGLGSPVCQNYDGTNKAYYLDSNTGCCFPPGGVNIIPMMWPTGVFGPSGIAPKNSNTSAVWIKYRAAFSANSDYTIHGVGAAGTDGAFIGSAAFYDGGPIFNFIQVTRNAGVWELGSCDGTTVSQQSGGTADGNLHTFAVKWSPTSLELYVDDVLTITKTTNLPIRPLGPAFSFPNGLVGRIYDSLVEWEVA